jgi:hypothetical protein
MKGLLRKDVGQALQDERMKPIVPFIMSMRYSRLMGWKSSANVSFDQVLSEWGVTREDLPRLKGILQRSCLGFLAWVFLGFLISVYAGFWAPPHAALLEDFGIFMGGVALIVCLTRGFLLLVLVREKPLRWWDLLTGNW